ncbi:MAG: helix-turn-helix domain-containing protein [Actinomycetota bacterium]|nr:MAG: helix-turn-helix domain-containing protein [Actinomycetota bacterium]
MGIDDGSVKGGGFDAVADLVQRHRILAGLTVVDAAKAAGVGRTKWTEVEAGQSAKPETLARMAIVVGLEPAELLALVDPRFTPPAASEPGNDLVARLLRLGDVVQRLADRVGDLERRVDALDPPAPAPTVRPPRPRSQAQR